MPASVPPPMSSLAVPGATIAGKYRLDSLVGYGGMGSVWAATHLGLGHQIAIKLISKAHASTPEIRRRFDTEAKAVARLKSRHVVQIYDNGELADGTPFIAMELLSGESLHKRIHSRGPVQVPEAVAIVTQACRALSKAHAAGIIHRDIKPDNIFLAQSDDDGTILAKVLDFGVAKIAHTESETSSTQTGSLVGTPLYMSPEQARGLKGIDHRTDLYSLALVTYTMLSGNLAFHAESFGDLLLNICTQPLPSLRQSAPWLPVAIDAWFQRAAARDAKDRFQSAQEFADAFAIAAGEIPSRPTFGSVADQSGPVRVVLPASETPLSDSSTNPFERRAVGLGSANTITGATMQAPPPAVPPAPPSTGSLEAPKGRGRLAPIAVGVTALPRRPSASGACGTGRRRSPRPHRALRRAPQPRPRSPPKFKPSSLRGAKRSERGVAIWRRSRSQKGPTRARRQPSSGSSRRSTSSEATRARGASTSAGRGTRGRRSHRATPRSSRPSNRSFQREPADFAESTARLETALKTFPDDAEMHYLLGSNLGSMAGQRDQALAELKRSIALDPNQPHVLDIVADSQAYRGEFAAAKQAIDDCLRIAPDGLECLGEQVWEDSEQGACDRVEAASRRMLAVDPAFSGRHRRALANALYAQGRSLDSARRRFSAGERRPGVSIDAGRARRDSPRRPRR